ncbi:unnamed protein product [Hydatigera taeniaeformis]|uniref:C2 domain-containing protein n=1 Tax=Hydatigena taeniaeformis TaxID=6205 RepID=A0A0R3WP57_HYDTA|nr:unnamed protein product [Hydatigera taeniaeformis]
MDDELGTEVEISIACRNLADTDVLSKSDPVVVVFEFCPALEDWREIWRSETIQNNLNPNFSRKLVLQYHFEEQKKLKFAVYDVDDPNEPLRHQDEITFNISAKNLDKKDIIGLSDPFLAFYRLHENGSVTVAHRTEVIKNTLNPSWSTMILPVRLLCNGDLNRYVLHFSLKFLHSLLRLFS